MPVATWVHVVALNIVIKCSLDDEGTGYLDYGVVAEHEKHESSTEIKSVRFIWSLSHSEYPCQKRK